VSNRDTPDEEEEVLRDGKGEQRREEEGERKGGRGVREGREEGGGREKERVECGFLERGWAGEQR